jgi:hypothetical protein
MGAVYEAEQDQPRRTVALKVIKPGLASPELLRRFAQESQALGRLQHPGIAQIYEAGTADAGYGPQPYFAMEFIRGETLRDYAQKHRLNTRRRLEIVAKICDAVHHAHQRGLIHRDLKPGNIIVDETGQPKILDFGVARVTDSDAQATMQTDVGQLVGTLAYMSPEQVLADPLELDTRSDVYALGVILYELLAGKLPYNISRKLHEALQAIREEDPSKLSSIDRAYRGDIETIAAKALEKDKSRRYASAAELAADIQHYLKDEPIVARPPSTSYQLQKFARRHKALVGGIAAVFVVLLAGVVVSTWQAVRASRAEATALRDRDRAAAAEQAATIERDKAVKAQGQAVASEAQAKLERDKAVSEKERADTESATAKAVTEFLQKNLFEQVSGRGQRGGSEMPVNAALDRAAARIDGAYEKRPLVEAGVREAVGSAYASLALFGPASAQFERALALRRKAQNPADAQVINTMQVLANIYASQKRTIDAESLFAEVVSIRRRTLGNEHSDTLKVKLDLAAMYLIAGKGDKAEPLAKQVVDVRRRQLGDGHKDTISAMLALAGTYQVQKKSAQALSIATVAYDSSRRALGENDALTAASKTVYQALYALVNRTTIKPDMAELFAGATRSIDAQPISSLPEMIRSATTRAKIAVAQGHPEDAEPSLLQALDASRRAGSEDLSLLGALVEVYAPQKKYTEAESLLRRITDNPASSNASNADILTSSWRSLGNAYRRESKFAEAEPYLVKLVTLERSTQGESVQQTRVDMAALVETYAGLKKYAPAEEILKPLLVAQRRFASPDGIVTLGVAANLGWVQLQQKMPAEAQRTLQETADILRRTAPNSWDRHNVESMLGASLAAQKKFDQAEPLLVSGYEGMARNQRAPNTPTNARFTLEQAADAVVQLYADWKKPEKEAEWKQRLTRKQN